MGPFTKNFLLFLVFFLALALGMILFLWTYKPFANFPFVINLKNLYYNNLTNYYPTITPIQVVTYPDKISYMYVLSGRFQQLDPTTKTIYIKNVSNELYAFTFPIDQFNNFVYYVKSEDGVITPVKFSLNDFSKSDPPFIANQDIYIQWEDPRTLEQIMAETKASSSVARINGAESEFFRIGTVEK